MAGAPNLEEFDTDDIVEYFQFLDDLRESGDTNMWGAAPYLQNEYWLGKKPSANITLAWMHTFSHEKTAEERAKEAIEQAEFEALVDVVANTEQS